jgi:hypothetical protein
MAGNCLPIDRIATVLTQLAGSPVPAASAPPLRLTLDVG